LVASKDSNQTHQNQFRTYLISSFVGDLVIPVFNVYLPLFAYEIGATPFEIGLVGGANYLMFSFVPLLMGHFSDRVQSRKKFVLAALLIVCLVSTGYSFSDTPAMLILLRLSEGVGWSMLWPSIEAGINETSHGPAGQGLGLYNFIWSSASAIGPLFGAVLIFTLSTRTTFLVTASILTIPIFLNIRAIRRDTGVRPGKNRPEADFAEPKHSVRLGFRTVLEKNILYIACVILTSMTVGTLLTFFSPYAESAGISVLVIGGVVFSYGAARFVSFFLLSKSSIRQTVLSHRNRRRIVLIAVAVSSISGIIFFIADRSIPLYILACVFVAAPYPIVTSISQVALIAEAPASQMGRGSGIGQSAIGFGSFIGPFLGGLFSGGSLRFPFILPTIITGVLIFPLILLSLRQVNPVKNI
jgi:MFS family permease